MDGCVVGFLFTGKLDKTNKHLACTSENGKKEFLLPELISCVVASAPMEMVPQAEKGKCPIAGNAFSFHGKSLPYVKYVPDGRE